MSQVRRPLLYSSLVRTSRLQLGHLTCIGISLKEVAVTTTCWRKRKREREREREREKLAVTMYQKGVMLHHSKNFRFVHMIGKSIQHCV